VALSQFVLPRPVALRAVVVASRLRRPGAELDLPAVLRLARYGIPGARRVHCLARRSRPEVAVWCRIASGPMLSPGLLFFGERSGRGRHAVHRGRWPVAKRSRVDRIWGAIGAHASALGVPVSLRVLCETVAARLPVTGVAVAIRGGFMASEPVCVTDPLSRRLEELQLTLGEGPTLEVLAGAPAILVEDLDTPVYQARWPLFAPTPLTSAPERYSSCRCV
jgi:hypothetical protein